jgi:uncharacterized protein YybS (DUF2232 family)
MGERPGKRDARWLLPAVAAGLAAAGLYLLAASGSLVGMVVGQAASLPIWLIALATGTGGALASTGVAAAMLGALTDIRVGLLFAAFFGLPAVIVATLVTRRRVRADGAVEWFPTGWLAGGLIAIGVVLTVVGLLALPGPLAEARHLIARSMRIALGPMFTADVAPEMLEQVIAMASSLPAILIVAWVLLTTVNGVIAQLALRGAGRALRRAEGEADAFILPPDVAAAVGFCALFMVLGSEGWGYVAGNVLLVLSTAYMVAGFAALHGWARRFSQPRWVLIASYAVVAVLNPLLVPLTMWGFIDQWVRWRRSQATAAAS